MKSQLTNVVAGDQFPSVHESPLWRRKHSEASRVEATVGGHVQLNMTLKVSH